MSGQFYPISKVVVSNGHNGVSLFAASTAPAPPLGTVQTGELLVDAQYKTIWLGVDAAVDPVTAILISDMASLMQTDIDNLAEAKAYTDQQIATRAPLNHTHPASQISDFNAAVDARIALNTPIKSQMIAMFAGSLSWVGNNTGPVDLTGWAICNGSSGTPDLRDRFVFGAGNKEVLAKNTINPNALKQTGGGGKHAHGRATATFQLNAANLPPHTHGYQEDYKGASGEPDGHTHKLIDFGAPTTLTLASGGSTARSFWIKSTSDVTTQAHPINITILPNTTSNVPHSHVIYEEADHTHSFPADSFEAVPYVVLAFIMKL